MAATTASARRRSAPKRASTRAPFYHFFPSKTDLLIEVIEVRIKAVEQMMRPSAPATLSPPARSLSLFDLPFSEASESPAAASASGFFLGNHCFGIGVAEPAGSGRGRACLPALDAPLSSVLSSSSLRPKTSRGSITSGAAEAILGLLQGGAVVASA